MPKSGRQNVHMCRAESQADGLHGLVLRLVRQLTQQVVVGAKEGGGPGRQQHGLVLHSWGGRSVSYLSGAEGHTRGCSGRRKAGSHAAR